MNEANGSEPSNRPTISEASCSCAMNRRGFLGASLGCGAYVAMALAAAPVMTRRAFAQQPKGEAQLTMPFARVEKIADGVWAVVSVTSGGDYTTVMMAAYRGTDFRVIAGASVRFVVDVGNWDASVCINAPRRIAGRI